MSTHFDLTIMCSYQSFSRLMMVVVVAGCSGKPRHLSEPGQPLLPCPDSPNCVSTESTDRRHQMLVVPFNDSPADAQLRVRKALEGVPRTKIVSESTGYLRAETRSALFRFVDDVEIIIDSTAQVFRFRSASRLGRGDLGVNRARMTAVSLRLASR